MCVCAVIVQAFKSNVHVNVGLYIRSCTSVLTAAKLHSSTVDPSIHTCVDSRQTVLEHSALFVCVCMTVYMYIPHSHTIYMYCFATYTNIIISVTQYITPINIFLSHTHTCMYMYMYVQCRCVPYSGKFSREKTFTNFAIFREILGMPHPLCDQF